METVIRVALLYLFVLVALRLLGKREFSQMTAFDLVTILLIPELAAQALVREDFSMTNAFVALGTLFTLVLLTSVFSHMNRRAEHAIEGSPTVLVSEGAFIPEHLNLERITPGEIYGEMHKVGLWELTQVRWAILETDGKISFIPYARDGFHGSTQSEDVSG